MSQLDFNYIQIINPKYFCLMKNFAMLAKNCVGFTPLATIGYIQKCTNQLHTEKVFAGMLKYALTKINESTDKKNRCYLYIQPKKEWNDETLLAFENAETLYKDEYGKEAKIRLYKFRGEEKFNYYFIKADQLGEKFELLFVEEL